MSNGDLTIHQSRDALVNLLVEHGAQFQGNKCRCLFHEEKHASAGVYVKDNVWRFQCQVPSCGVGGDYFDMKARLENKELRDVLPHETKPTPAKLEVTYPTLDALLASIIGRIEAVYEYTKEFYEIRYWPPNSDQKVYCPAHIKNGKWVRRAPEGQWVLYNVASLGETEDATIIVEGEKCVDALREISITAITSAGGAKSAKRGDWKPLASRDVILWPDNDDSGKSYMDEVSAILLTLNPPARVRRIDVKALNKPVKWDVADCLVEVCADTVETKRAIVNSICAKAVIVSPVGELFGILEDTISGKREAVPMSWLRLNKLARPFMPGCITFLCGAPGCGKSFLLLESGYFMHKRGVNVALFMLEEDASYHLHRLLAQLSETSDLLDPDWVKENPEKTRNIAEMYQEELASFTRTISDVPNDTPRIEHLLDWTRDKAKAGARVIAIDPISVADMGREPWTAATQFMNAAKRIAVEFDTSIIVTVHPRKGTNVSGIVDLDSVSGGAAFTRLSQTVFWIERHIDEHVARINSGGGYPVETRSNRTVHILKSRNGPGQGTRLAFNFDPATLRFDELGIIAADHKRGSYQKQNKAAYNVNSNDGDNDVPF